MAYEPMILWREGDWRCEFHPAAGGDSRLKVFHGEKLATIEAAPAGTPAFQRANILRHRVLRGDLRAGDGLSSTHID
jgi:hypothetical protein